MLDANRFYDKLAANEPIPEDDLVALLKELSHLQSAVAYLAQNQALALERLPKSASNAARAHHVALCQTAAMFLEGVSHPFQRTDPAEALQRCKVALEQATGAST